MAADPVPLPSRRPIIQITGYVTPEEREAFVRYAQTLDVSSSTLLTLLVRRELRFCRLAQLAELYPRPADGDVLLKVIAHLDADEMKKEFEDHARRHAMKVSQAAGILKRAELSEQWFRKATLQQPEA